MTPIQWTESVVGKPWMDRSDGPDAFDCWGLVVDSFRRMDGVELNQVVGYADGEPIEQAGPIEASSGQWKQIDRPQHGAVFCCYTAGGALQHVGRVLHLVGAGLYCIHARGSNNKGQVAADPVRLIERAYHKVTYYMRAV